MADRRRSSWAGTLVVLAVVVAAVAVGALVTRGGDTAAVQRLRLPGSVEERWRTALETPEVYAVAGSDDVVMVAVGWDTTLVALDRDSGKVRWQQELATGRSWLIEVVGDVVVVETSPARRDVEVIAVDVQDGDVLWRRTLHDDQGVSTEQPLVLTTRRDSADHATIEVLDSRSGHVTARATGAVLGERRGELIVRRGDEIDLIDARTLRRRDGLHLNDELDVGRLHDVDYHSGAFLLAGSRGAVVVRGGNHTVRIDGPAAYATITGGAFAISRSYGWVEVYVASGDGLERVARSPGTAIRTAPPADSPILLIHPTGPTRSFEQPRTLVVDARTGTQIGPPQQHSVAVADNGYVTVQAGQPEEPAAIQGRRLNGDLMWTVPHDPFGQFHVIDNALLVVTADVGSGTTTLALHG